MATAFAPQPSTSALSQGLTTPPDSNPVTPDNVSPASPRSVWSLPAHLQQQNKQIRAPKTPLYVPAVLRPTEKLPRQSPPKNGQPSATYGSSPDSARSSIDGRSILTEPVAPRPTLTRVLSGEWSEETTLDVSGPPSRNHWKPDPSSPICDSPTCDRPFSLFLRRHHCRRCGNIFCSEHTPHSIPLDQQARFHPQAPRYRACEDCFRDYRVWEVERVKRSNSSSSETSSATEIPGEQRASMEIKGKKKSEGGFMNALAQSVPRDWNWSTF